MNLSGAILAGLAVGISVATLVCVLVILRRPIEVVTRQLPPRPPRHGDRAPAWGDRRGRQVVASAGDGGQDLDDDDPDSAPWPPPDPWPPHGDPPPDELTGAQYAPVPGGLYVRTGAADPVPVPAPDPAAVYARPYAPEAPYPQGNAILRTYATPDLGRIAPGHDGTWNPREQGPARPYVPEPGQ